MTGANGFVGRNLVASLEAIRDGKDHVHKIRGYKGYICPETIKIITYDKESTRDELETACKDCDFIFHLAA